MRATFKRSAQLVLATAALLALSGPATASANAIYVDVDRVKIHDKLDGDLTSCGDFNADDYRIGWAPEGQHPGLLTDGRWNLLVPEATLLHDSIWDAYWRQCDNTTYEFANSYADPEELFDDADADSPSSPANLVSNTVYMHGGTSRLGFSGEPGQSFDLWLRANEFDPAILSHQALFAGLFERKYPITAPPAGETWGFARTAVHTGGGPDVKLTISGTIRTSHS